MIDFERGAKVAGSKFYFLTGEDAMRELSLIYNMIWHHVQNGYEFVIPPYMVREEVGVMAGILPRFDGEYYKTDDKRILIPTAETPLVGMHSNEIFKEEDLPIRYVAFSPCFRKEGGAGGQRDKGLKRVHQFHKIELFVICRPEDSEAEHLKMVADVCNLLTQFQLTFRQVELTPEDRSPVSNKTIDIELLVGEEWLEVSSISNMGDNQSKPAQIRYKPKDGGKNRKVHLLNGSGVALPRLQLAFIEKEKNS
jgi:seryl-tRNA synthetase